jgi:hypothetical protein
MVQGIFGFRLRLEVRLLLLSSGLRFAGSFGVASFWRMDEAVRWRRSGGHDVVKLLADSERRYMMFEILFRAYRDSRW